MLRCLLSAPISAKLSSASMDDRRDSEGNILLGVQQGVDLLELGDPGRSGGSLEGLLRSRPPSSAGVWLAMKMSSS